MLYIKGFVMWFAEPITPLPKKISNPTSTILHFRLSRYSWDSFSNFARLELWKATNQEHVFCSTSISFKPVGFPQYGCKQNLRYVLFAVRNQYTRTQSLSIISLLTIDNAYTQVITVLLKIEKSSFITNFFVVMLYIKLLPISGYHGAVNK